MRIHTPKLKAPHPLAVLAIALLWPAAALIGAMISNANAEQLEQQHSMPAEERSQHLEPQSSEHRHPVSAQHK